MDEEFVMLAKDSTHPPAHSCSTVDAGLRQHDGKGAN
jgi:hypothetical protein